MEVQLDDTKEENFQLEADHREAMMTICASYFSALFRTTVTVRQATAQEDMKEATDLVVYTPRGPLRIACRVRRWEYYQKYSHELVIGSQHYANYPSELYKIVDLKLGDYYLYGFADRRNTHLMSWALIRLDTFRRHLKYTSEEKSRPVRISGEPEDVSYERELPLVKWEEKPDDHGGKMIAYDLRTFPSEMIVNSYNCAMAPPRRRAALEWLASDYPAAICKAPLMSDWDMINRLLTLGAKSVEVEPWEIRYVGSAWSTRHLYISIPSDPKNRLEVMMYIATLYPEDIVIVPNEQVVMPESPAPTVLKLTWSADATF